MNEPIMEHLQRFFTGKDCPQFNDAAKVNDITERVARNGGKSKPFSPQAWMMKHPQAYVLFRQFTLEALNRGVTVLGAKAVAERIRWESTLKRTGDFKLNNNVVAAMARRFMQEYPAHQVFMTRGKGGNSHD